MLCSSHPEIRAVALFEEPFRFVGPEGRVLRFHSRRLRRYSYMLFKDEASAEEGARFLERTRTARRGSVEVRRLGDLFSSQRSEGPKDGAFMGQEKRRRP